MQTDQFWDIIRDAAGQARHEEEYLDRIKSRLMAMGPAGCEQFDRHVLVLLHRAHTRDLRGAAELLLGVDDDMEFMEFVLWLIAQGEDVYEDVLEEPDLLGELLTPGENPTWPDFGALAIEAYIDLTDEEQFEGWDHEGLALDWQTPASAWKSKNELSARFPKLWDFLRREAS